MSQTMAAMDNSALPSRRMHAERRVRVWQKCCHLQLNLHTIIWSRALGSRKIYSLLGGGAKR
jgi:hypothetical protein